MPKPLNENAVILEFVTKGNYVRVSAIDPRTGIEAVIVGSTRMTEAYLKMSAIRKLKYQLEKK